MRDIILKILKRLNEEKYVLLIIITICLISYIFSKAIYEEGLKSIFTNIWCGKEGCT